MKLSDFLNWVVAIGALSGYASLAWTVYRERQTRREKVTGSVTASMSRRNLSIVFHEPEAHGSYTTEIRMLSPNKPALCTITEEYDGDGSYRPVLSDPMKRPSIKMWHQVRGLSRTGALMVVVAVDEGAVASARIKVRVRIVEQASGKCVARRSFILLIPDH